MSELLVGRGKKSPFKGIKRTGRALYANHTLEHTKHMLHKSESQHVFKPTDSRIWSLHIPIKEQQNEVEEEEKYVNRLYDKLHRPAPVPDSLPSPTNNSNLSSPSAARKHHHSRSFSTSSFLNPSFLLPFGMRRSATAPALHATTTTTNNNNKPIVAPRGAAKSGIAHPKELERYETTKSAVARHDANIEQVGFALSLRLLGNDVQERLLFLDEHQGDPILERRRKEDIAWQKQFFWDHLHTISNTLHNEAAFEKHSAVSNAAMTRRKCDAIARLSRDAQRQAYDKATKEQAAENDAFDDRFSWRKEIEYGYSIINETNKILRAEKQATSDLVENKWRASEETVAEFASTGHDLFVPFEQQVADRHLRDLKKNQKKVHAFDKSVQKTAEWHANQYKRLERDIAEMRKAAEEKVRLEHKRKSCEVGRLKVVLRRVDGLQVPSGIRAKRQDVDIPISMRLGFHLKQSDVDGNEDSSASKKFYSRAVTAADGSQWFNQQFEFDVPLISNSKLLVTCEVLPFDRGDRAEQQGQSVRTTNTRSSSSIVEVNAMERTGLEVLNSVEIDEADMANDWQDDDESKGLTYKATSSPMFSQLSNHPIKFDKWLRDGFTHMLSSFELTMSDVRQSKNGKLKRSWLEFCGESGKIQCEFELIADFTLHDNRRTSRRVSTKQNRLTLGEMNARRKTGKMGDIFAFSTLREDQSRPTSSATHTRSNSREGYASSRKNLNNQANLRSSKRLSGNRRLSINSSAQEEIAAAVAAVTESAREKQLNEKNKQFATSSTLLRRKSKEGEEGLHAMLLTADAMLPTSSSSSGNILSSTGVTTNNNGKEGEGSNKRQSRMNAVSRRRNRATANENSTAETSSASVSRPVSQQTPRDPQQPSRGSLRVTVSRETTPALQAVGEEGNRGISSPFNSSTKLTTEQANQMFPSLVPSKEETEEVQGNTTRMSRLARAF